MNHHIIAFVSVVPTSSAQADMRFLVLPEFLSGQDPRGIEAADFNADGHVDLVTADMADQVSSAVSD